MPRLPDDEQQAMARFSTSFAPPRRLDKFSLTDKQRRRLLNYLRFNAALLVRERMLIERSAFGVVANYVAQEVSRVSQHMRRNGGWDAIERDALRVARDLSRKGGSKREHREAVQRYLAEGNPTVVDATLKEAVRNLHGGAFLELDGLMLTARVLLAESGARFAHEQVAAVDGKALFSARLMKAKPITFSAVDNALIRLLFGRPHNQIFNLIQDRNRRYRAANLVANLLEDLRTELHEQLYAGLPSGPLGPSVAKKIIGEYQRRLESAGLPTASLKTRLELWARTEGAVLQNNALLETAIEAGMDGKVWQSVGDDRVRPAHVCNEADGVIGLNELFCDGSSNAGSGSVSPWNCRCACGGAMLPPKKRGKTGPEAAVEPLDE